VLLGVNSSDTLNTVKKVAAKRARNLYPHRNRGLSILGYYMILQIYKAFEIILILGDGI
jgi:hypothetical protein